jgi:hypothetical protein
VPDSSAVVSCVVSSEVVAALVSSLAESLLPQADKRIALAEITASVAIRFFLKISPFGS